MADTLIAYKYRVNIFTLIPFYKTLATIIYTPFF